MSKAPKVIILSGISGSGKSTYAHRLCGDLDSDDCAKVVSADHFFQLEDGTYAFDAARLSEAHGACFRAFLGAVQDDYSLVIVDNTNLSSEEIAPYVLGAQAFDCEVEIHTLNGSVPDCHARNVHGVSRQSIERQHRRLAECKLMPWWKSVQVTP